MTLWNIKNYKTILWVTIWEQIGQTREMDKFIDTHSLAKLNPEETETLNRPVLTNKIKVVIKILATKKRPG